MTEKVFVDTNVLVYAHDLDAGEKREVAARVLRALWENKQGVLSVQVLQEFYVTVTRKIPGPLPLAVARGIIENYAHWPVFQNTTATLLYASEIQERWLLSFWDALIVAAASESGAGKFLTEDLNEGQLVEGLLIENPFHKTDITQGAAHPRS